MVEREWRSESLVVGRRGGISIPTSPASLPAPPALPLFAADIRRDTLDFSGGI